MADVVPLIIDGKEIRTSTTFPVISPFTSQAIWQSSSASKEDAIAAVDAASRAFPSWSKSSIVTRRNIFLKAADVVESQAEELSKWMAEETGSLAPFAGFNVKGAADLLREIAGRISAALTGSIPICEDENKSALVIKEPFGVVLGIAPWNAPYILGFRAVAYAIAVGNTAIFKGSEISPRSHLAIATAFQKAGLPDGVLNFLIHRPQDAASVTTALIEHPAVRKVNFTGSTAVGSIIAATAGKHLKPVLMELGGKASAIVCEDADIQKAAVQCAVGSFLHSGQICMSTERVLVHKSILVPFSEALKAATNQIFDPATTPLDVAQPAGVDKNKKLIADAVAKGANLIQHDFDPSETSKYRMRPIIVRGVTKDMDLYYTESFGPSVSLIPVESDEEAIAIANDTEYGLSGAVFTENLARGLKIAKQIDTGAVHINAMSVHDEAGLPHGGAKKSGWGRFNASWGLDEFLKTKTITFQS